VPGAAKLAFPFRKVTWTLVPTGNGILVSTKQPPELKSVVRAEKRAPEPSSTISAVAVKTTRSLPRRSESCTGEGVAEPAAIGMRVLVIPHLQFPPARPVTEQYTCQRAASCPTGPTLQSIFPAASKVLQAQSLHPCPKGNHAVPAMGSQRLTGYTRGRAATPVASKSVFQHANNLA